MEYLDAANGSNANLTNCSLFTSERAKTLAMYRGYAALCVAIALLFLLAIVFTIREFDIRLFGGNESRRRSCLVENGERLFIYMVLAAILPSIGFTLHGFEHKYASEYGHTSELCMISAFLVQAFGWTEFLIMFGVAVSLLATFFYTSTNGNGTGGTGLTESSTSGLSILRETMISPCTRKACIWETTFLTFAIVFPFAINWVPFLYGDYGEAGPWCWITSVRHDCTHSKRGFAEQLGLWYIPFVVISVVINLVIFVTACVSCRLPHSKSRRVGFLLFYYFLYLLLEAIEVGARIRDYSPLQDSYRLWQAYAICTPLSKLVGPLAFALYLGYFLPKRKRPNKEYVALKPKSTVTDELENA